MSLPVLQTDLPLSNKRTGKVRDLYDIDLPTGEPGLLIIATDRVSAFDVVLGTGLPGKGVVLTQISKFWFDYFESDYNHHLVSTDVNDIGGISDQQRTELRGRVMLCRKTEVVPVECIARGYITGSGWKDYQRTGTVCGIQLPSGLQNGDRLAEPLFTPSTKAEAGLHDENISFEQGAEIVGTQTMKWLNNSTLKLYNRASDYARERGIILADTKFEFGTLPGSETPIVIDEIFTPDSSRFWAVDEWNPGGEQPSFDKQIVRNYLETIVAADKWDKTPPGPQLPDHIVEKTMSRYLDAYQQLTGSTLSLPDMDWEEYKELCDTPNVFSRWALTQTLQFAPHAPVTKLATALESQPLAKPMDHKGDARTDMFVLNLVPSEISEIRRYLESGTTTVTDQKLPPGLVAAWREYEHSFEKKTPLK